MTFVLFFFLPFALFFLGLRSRSIPKLYKQDSRSFLLNIHARLSKDRNVAATRDCQVARDAQPLEPAGHRVQQEVLGHALTDEGRPAQFDGAVRGKLSTNQP